MAELINQTLSIVRATWRRRWIGLLVAWVVAGIGAAMLLRIPDRYEASARVYVDTRSVLKPLMRDLTVELDMDRAVVMLARTLITRPNVERLLASPGVDFQLAESGDRERVIAMLMGEIRVSGGHDNVYSFAYRDAQPERARQVVHSLVSLFVESDVGNKRRDAEAARAFIDDQIKGYEARLSEAENRLKEFKLRNLGVIEGQGKDYFSRIASLNDELQKQSIELAAGEQARDALKRELTAQAEPVLVPATPPEVPTATPELDARLDTQRKLLDDLLRRYTDEHPDVIATRRLIDRLEEQKQQHRAELQRRAAETGPPGASASANPALPQVKLALAEAEANVAALQVRARDTRARMGQLRAAANRVPQIEAELAQLNRDYDVVRRNYETLVARREKASISEDVDASSRLAHFRVIDPPRTIPQAVFPNRLVLAALVLVVALVAGVMASFGMAQLVPTFDSGRLLRSVTQRQVLGSVSMLWTPAMKRHARRHNLTFAAGLAGLLLVHGGWLSWLAMATRA